MPRLAWMAALISALAVGNLFAQTYDLDTDLVVTNGAVLDIDQVDDTLYIAGSFNHLGDLSGSGILLDATTEDLHPNQPDFGFYTTASVPDGNGGMFVAGAEGLRHLLADGTEDPNWEPAAIGVGSVNAMVTSGERLYIAGTFKEVSAEVRWYLAALDANTGQMLPWNAGVWRSSYPTGASLSALAIQGSTLYVGGRFNAAGTSASSSGQLRGFVRTGVAAFDVNGPTLLDWNPGISVSFAGGAIGVTSLAVDDDFVYIGGEFPFGSGLAAPNLLRVYSADASPESLRGKADGSWVPSPDMRLRAMELTDDSLIIGGEFTTVSGEARERLAEIDLVNGGLTAWNPGADGTVRTIEPDGDIVRVGGDFTTLAGEPRSRVGAVDANTGVATTWAPEVDKEVYTISRSGSLLFLGGYFALMNAVERNGAAAIDLLTGAVTPWNPDVIETVHAIVPTADRVFLGGNFYQVGGELISQLAAVNATTGSPVSGWDPSPNGIVYALDTDGTRLFVAGTFNDLDGTSRPGLAAIDMATGAVLPWDPDAQGSDAQHAAQLQELVLNGDTVYLGGTIGAVGGEPRFNLASVSATTGLATAFAPSLEGTVQTIAALGSRVFAGGSLREPNAGGSPAWRYLAAFDATTGDHLDWGPLPNQVVNTLVATNSRVFVGGYFSQLDGENHSGLVALNALTGSPEAWQPKVNNVEALHLNGSSLFVGGNFNEANFSDRNYLARYDNVLPPTVVVSPEAVADFLIGLGGLTPEEQAAADANIDGKVDVADVVTVVNQE